jgi:VIT1/CCC1 family predicted Fe2+/Mn2+ transporter
MKINGKKVLLCLIGYIIGVALPITLTYCGVSREVIVFMFWFILSFVLVFGFSRFIMRKNNRF